MVWLAWIWKILLLNISLWKLTILILKRYWNNSKTTLPFLHSSASNFKTSKLYIILDKIVISQNYNIPSNTFKFNNQHMLFIWLQKLVGSLQIWQIRYSFTKLIWRLIKMSLKHVNMPMWPGWYAYWARVFILMW